MFHWQSAKTADWLSGNDVDKSVLRNCGCAKWGVRKSNQLVKQREGANFYKWESLWILFMGIIKYFSHVRKKHAWKELFILFQNVCSSASKSLTPTCQFIFIDNHAWDCAFSWRGVLVRRQIYKSLSNQGTGNGKLLRSWKQLADDPKAFASSCHILEPSLAGRCLLKLSRGRTASISTHPLGFLFDCCRPKSPQNCLGRHHCPRRHFLGHSRRHCLVHHLPNTWNERAQSELSRGEEVFEICWNGHVLRWLASVSCESFNFNANQPIHCRGKLSYSCFKQRVAYRAQETFTVTVLSILTTFAISQANQMKWMATV